MNPKEHLFYEFGPFRLDATEGVLVRGGQPVRLTPKALKLLLVLVRNGGHILNKDELMEEVWPDATVEETNLAGNIHALRQALGEAKDEHKYIETVPKRGYRFVAKTREMRDENFEATVESTKSARVDLDEEIGKSADSEVSTAASTNVSVARPGTIRPLLQVLLVGFILAGFTFAASYFWMSSTRRSNEDNLTVRSIAVLPLTNLSSEPEQEYFADGMTDALINELAKIGKLRVISRTSMMQYKNARKKTPEIARELKVDAVVEGSVLRSGDRVRITAQLIRAEDDQHLWAESYERDLRDVLALQREIARGIASQVRIKLTPEEQARLTRTHPVNPAAHEAYLKGLYYTNQAINTPETKEFERLHKKSFEYFEQAINFDPNYALAYSGLAGSYHWLASSRFPEFYPKAKEAALKAIALDDTLAEAHSALAYTIWRHEWEFAGAEREFKIAEELAPNSDNWGYAQFLSTIGRHDEAIRRFRLAQDLDPLTLPLKINVGWAYLFARKYDDAIAQFRTVIELAPNRFDAHDGLGTAYILKGMHEEGLAECKKALDFSGEMPDKANLAWAYAMAGRRNDAIKILDELKNPFKQKLIQNYRVAMIYAALGEKDLAMAYLEKAYSKRETVLWLKVDPQFDGLRSDPRFTDLMRRVGLP